MTLMRRAWIQAAPLLWWGMGEEPEAENGQKKEVALSATSF